MVASFLGCLGAGVVLMAMFLILSGWRSIGTAGAAASAAASRVEQVPAAPEAFAPATTAAPTGDPVHAQVDELFAGFEVAKAESAIQSAESALDDFYSSVIQRPAAKV
jgi:hypothetical protein